MIYLTKIGGKKEREKERKLHKFNSENKRRLRECNPTKCI